jgi:uncharacterized protein (TIGR03118 family)
MKAARFAIATTVLVPLTWSYGCGSSSSNPSPAPDGGDATTFDGPSVQESGADVESGAEAGGEAAPPGDSGVTGIAQKVTQTNLFANAADGGAPHIDPNLMNPWGLAFNPMAGVAWISDNGAGLLTLYKTNLPAPLPLVVTVPPAGGDAGATATPTGQVFNPGAASGDFKGDQFIVSTEDGTVAGWSSTANAFSDAGTATATIQCNNSAEGAVYKGLAIDPTTPPMLLLADFHNARVDVLDATYKRITPVVTADGGAAWSDPSVPAGYAPYNIAVFGTKVYITYAKQNPPANHEYVLGRGLGALSVFDMGGNLLASLVPTGGALNAPWGMAVAPTGWGQLGGMLLVGNFGDGHVNAFNPTNGNQIGTLVTSSGAPLAIDGLWSLMFGVNVPDAGVTASQLYFTSGPNMEMGGLFGYLTPQ